MPQLESSSFLLQLEQSAHSQQQRSQAVPPQRNFFIEKLENKDKLKIETKKPSMI